MLAICVPMIVYTTIGGVQAVAWTDVKQMFIVVGGHVGGRRASCCYGILQRRQFRAGAAPGRRDRAAQGGRLQVRSARDLHVLVGMIGGLFLMLSYFGCDQSQVQRYLTAKSIDEARQLAADERLRQDPAAAADPGDRRPGVRVLPVPDAADAVQPRRTTPRSRPSPHGGGVRGARSRQFDGAIDARRRGGRARSTATAFLASDARVKRHPRPGRRRSSSRRPATSSYSDVNYVFPTFITTRMPIGLVGLMIAAIFAAAMSASGGELNALATATVIDFYRRHFVKEADRHALPDRVEAGDDRLGPVRVRRGDARRPTRARSSRSSTATDRSSTDRCSASSSSRF